MELRFSPHRAFCEAVQECLGLGPSAQFLVAYWSEVEKTPYTFLSDLIRGWVTQPFDQGCKHGMVNSISRATINSDTLSILFLLKVEPGRFLEFAYFDILGRPLEAADRAGYEGIDFAFVQNRIAVLNAMIGSLEAGSRPLKFVTEEYHQNLVKGRHINENIKIDLLANGIIMGKTAGLGMHDHKFPLLWKAADTRTLFCAFGMVANIKSDDGKPVSEAEWVFFGPKGPLSAGQYNLCIEIACQDNDLFHFDVVHRGGTKEIKSMKFFGSINTKLLMTLHEDVDDIEVRLANLNGRAVSVDIKEVSFAPVSI